MVSAALCHLNRATIDFRLFVVCLLPSKLPCAQIMSCMCVYRDYSRSVSIALSTWYFWAFIRVQRGRRVQKKPAASGPKYHPYTGPSLCFLFIKIKIIFPTRCIVLRLSSIIFRGIAKRILWSAFCKRQLEQHTWFTDTPHCKLSAPVENMLRCLRLHGDIGWKQQCLGLMENKKKKKPGHCHFYRI